MVQPAASAGAISRAADAYAARGATQRQRSLVAVAQSDARYALGKLAKADRARANEWMRDAVAIIDRQRAVDSLRRPALAAIGT